MLDIFKKLYTIKRFGKQEIVGGYVSHPYTEKQVMLNVQPLSANELKLLPEGERNLVHLKSFGKDELIAGDNITGITGDRLLYMGKWFRCKSATIWDHTPLAHCEAQWVECSSETEINGEEANQNDTTGA